MSSAAPTVVGYVEAATGTQVLGWAWAPREPGTRLVVQALLGEEVVAEASADQPRDDLARSGIGDGRHAFELTVPETSRPRLADLRVVARDASGLTVPLGAPPPPESGTERLDRLQHGVETLIASQRMLHRNLQAALLAPRPDADGVAELAKLQTETTRQLQTLEVFAMRLDERLAAPTAPGAISSSRLPRATLAALLIGAAALALSAWELLRSLPG
jgi:hypothetical protein